MCAIGNSKLTVEGQGAIRAVGGWRQLEAFEDEGTGKSHPNTCRFEPW